MKAFDKDITKICYLEDKSLILISSKEKKIKVKKKKKNN